MRLLIAAAAAMGASWTLLLGVPVAQADQVPTLGVAHPYEYATGFGTVRPSSFSFGSMSSSTVTQITWDSWGGPQAVGHGLNPNGAGNPMIPVTLTAFDLGDCNGQYVYRQVTETGPEGHPYTHNVCHGATPTG